MLPHNTWIEEQFPSNLLLIKKLVFDVCKLPCTAPIPEIESVEYSAFRFVLATQHICYREAKITPTKVGQFVTLWKRNLLGIIEPFTFLDTIDFVIVAVRKNNDFGMFLLPKTVLLEKGIFSSAIKEGKRAVRVYPPWDLTTNQQAMKTQQWQLNYFLRIDENKLIDEEGFKQLFRH